jgi:site-specific recombinase XerD
MMLEELQRRNYAQNTIDRYIYAVEDFSRHFKRSPDRLGPQHIREYQAELFTKRKLASSTVTIYLAALRFFYFKTLKKNWNISETPYPRKALRLPTVLSQEEVVRLIDAARTSYHRTLMMTLYATGLRRAELTHLKVTDVDSQRMVIHVRGGKGRKDRDVMLSAKLLEELREHWHRLKRKPSIWLFPGNRHHSGDQPITTKVVWQAWFNEHNCHARQKQDCEESEPEFPWANVSVWSSHDRSPSNLFLFASLRITCALN